MTNPISVCPIWGEGFPASVQSNPVKGIIEVTASPRAGGDYQIRRDGTDDVVGKLPDEQKAILTTWLIDQRHQGVDWPEVTEGILKYIKTKPLLPVHERADRLLRFIAEYSKPIGTRVQVNSSEPEALAWSESASLIEVGYLLRYLIEKDWLAGNLYVNSSFSGEVTVDGFGHIAEQATNVDLAQAFVAMWFGPSMDEAYRLGIEPAINEAGYKALRIDQKPHNNKIDDEIIAEIRRSKFLVADFTQGPDGARGGVYYEAGFAHGLGLKVIFTCRKDAIDKVHFDTNHYNHVVWETPVELLKGVKDRILAEFGQGPVSPNQ